MFSSQNPITEDILREAKAAGEASGILLCTGVTAVEDSDIQTLGHECLCGIAMILWLDRRDTYKAVGAAENEIRDSTYSQGFQYGWDGKTIPGERLHDEEFCIGHQHGVTLLARLAGRRVAGSRPASEVVRRAYGAN